MGFVSAVALHGAFRHVQQFRNGFCVNSFAVHPLDAAVDEAAVNIFTISRVKHLTTEVLHHLAGVTPSKNFHQGVIGPNPLWHIQNDFVVLLRWHPQFW